ncbi:MAG: hypothetical protein IPF99_38465 [Deltaproteobacteria bacterium]|nr:hypothetical protein [Deltaproteobacteria bacterium]
MALRLVRSGDGDDGSTSRRNDTEAYPFGETPLVVTFAARDDLSELASGQRLALASTPEISQDDAYLVMPQRAREHLVAAFARGQSGRVAQWFSEAWVVRADVDGGRSPKLWIGAAWRASSLLSGRAGRVVSMGGLGDPMRVINRLPFIESLARGGLLDAQGAEAILSRGSYVGVSRMGMPELGLGADTVEPTFVWTERDGHETRVRVALAAAEDDTPIALLSPLTLVA